MKYFLKINTLEFVRWNQPIHNMKDAFMWIDNWDYSTYLPSDDATDSQKGQTFKEQRNPTPYYDDCRSLTTMRLG